MNQIWREPLNLGFVRGVAPNKWATRWRSHDTKQRLELVAVNGNDLAADRAQVDVLLERVGEGALPFGANKHDRERHALRLYDEAIALVVQKEHELAAQEWIELDDLMLLELLDHPDHQPSWPAATPWQKAEWAPRHAEATMELVATGAGAAMMPFPLARQLAQKREHVVLPLSDIAAADMVPTTIWATWDVDRDDEDVQLLVGILRGRTSRSSR